MGAMAYGAGSFEAHWYDWEASKSTLSEPELA